MELTKLTIENVSSWADICFQFSNHAPIQFKCSYVNKYCFQKMIQSLLDVTYEKDLAYTRFELEEEGWMDLVLIMYPVKNLRVEFYKDVDWQTVGDELPENMPVPLLSFFTGWHDFSFKVSLAFKNHAQESFHHFIYPAEELKLLSKRMTGG